MTKFSWAFFNTCDPHDMTAPLWEEAEKLAYRWKTCACGKLSPLIPRDPFDGAPKDLELNNLGINFTFQVLSHKLCSARSSFKRIEKREAEILRQQKS